MNEQEYRERIRQLEIQRMELEVEAARQRVASPKPASAASGISIAALVCGFLIPALGFLLGLVGLFTAKNERSTNYSTIAVVTSIVWFTVLAYLATST